MAPYTNWHDAATNIYPLAMNAASSGDTIVASNGVYTVFNGAGIKLTKKVTITSLSGAASTILDGGGQAMHGIYAGNAVTATVHGLTIRNFTKSGVRLSDNLGVGLVLANCSIVDNSPSAVGGGIAVVHGSLWATNCLIRGNTAVGKNGGGVYFAASAIQCLLDGCEITGNVGGASGGGVYAERAGLVLRNSEVTGNTSYRGAGGVFLGTAGSRIETCTIISNETTMGDGGVAMTGDCTIQNSLVAYNTATGFVSNVGGGAVGGVNLGIGGTMRNCTVVKNVGGYYAMGAGGVGGGNGTVVNSLVYFNRSAFTPAASNHMVACTHVWTHSCTAPLPAGSNNTNAEPLFVDLAGGNYRLTSDSPCIDTGRNEDWMGTSTDLDGTNCRIVNATVDMGAYEYSDGSLNASFGANRRDSLAPTLNTFTALVSDPNPASLYYEWDFDNDGIADLEGAGLDVVTHSYTEPGYYSSALTVSNGVGETCAFTNLLHVKAGPITYFVATNGTAQFPYTNWAVAANSLPQVFGLLNHGDTVVVSNGTYEQAAQLTLSVGATVTSVNGAAETALVRPPAVGAFRVFQLNHASAVLEGFTIANGSLTAANNDGGGVYVSAGLLENCIVNTCFTSRDGGGVFLNNSAAALVRNCLLTGNTAGRYGGGAGISQKGALESCTIVDNTASNAGGGVAAVLLPGMQVINSVIYDNTGVLSDNNWTVVGSGSYAFTNCCTAPLAGLVGSDNIEADPLFKNPAAGDYRLRAGSLCFNAGLKLDWMDTAVDLDGQPRVLFRVPDIGAYESPMNKGILLIVK